jgi:hypothetical protein
MEVSIPVPELDIELPVPVLVVPDTHASGTCPEILGTNVLRYCKAAAYRQPSNVSPSTWEMVLNSLVTDQVFVRSSGAGCSF